MQRSRTILLLILPTLASACRADGEVQNPQTVAGQSAAVGEHDTERQAFVSLADSIAPLIDHFNAGKEKVRFLAVLSPT